LSEVSVLCALTIGCADYSPANVDEESSLSPENSQLRHHDAGTDAGARAHADSGTNLSADSGAGTDAQSSADGGSNAQADSGTVSSQDSSQATSTDSGSAADTSAPNPGVVDSGTSTQTKAGNPDGKCSQALPAEAAPIDSSQPTTVVGTGTAASCTADKLAQAIAQGGVITFHCGDEPTTIALTSTLNLRTDVNTVIDGGNKITLDGRSELRILSWSGGDWQRNTHTLTLQHLVLANGKASGTDAIPTRPEPCSQGYNDGEGGALFMRDGSLRAIDVIFLNNQAAELGPDTGGGALYLLGSKPAYIVSCTFKNNKGSNAGAMASLFTTDFIYDSLFEGNSAVGHGANSDDASQCSFINNNQHEIGSGGNGGAIYSDGVAMDVTICGTQIRNNAAGAFGAAVFFTSNDQSQKGTLSIRDSALVNNIPANQYWEWKPGISTNANTPEPISSSIQR
jgi:hypothetical protein